MIDHAVASPPPFADPRRIGAVIGLVGACNFVFSYAGGIGKAPALVAKILVSSGGALVLFGLIGLLYGTETGALMAAVASGLVMAALILAYAWGVFARPAGDVISVT